MLIDPYNKPNIKVLNNSLVTVNILYFLPEHRSILQSFLWQCHDLSPRYPRVHKFLNFWHKEIDAIISEVQIADSTGYKISGGIEIKDKFLIKGFKNSR